jgi:integrase
VKVGLIAINPVRNVQLAQTDPRGPVVLNAEQTTKLLQSAADDYPWAAVFLVAATSGLRQGELRGLCWPDIDLEAGTIRLARQLARVVDSDGIVGEGEVQVTRHWEFVALKTHASADEIVLPVSCVEALKAHHDKQAEWKSQSGISTEWTEHALVFTSENGLPLHQSSFAKALGRHLARAGLPRIRFHDLRHGYGSLLGDQNEPLSEIRDALRHASMQTTMRYVHPTRAKQERASRVDRVLFGARSNPDSADGAEGMKATTTGDGRQMVVTEPDQAPMIF